MRRATHFPQPRPGGVNPDRALTAALPAGRLPGPSHLEWAEDHGGRLPHVNESRVTVVVIAPSLGQDLQWIRDIDPRITVVDGNTLTAGVEGGERVGRYTFIGIEPYKKITSRGTTITIEENKKRRIFEGDIFAELKQSLSGHTPARLPGLPPFTAGAVGFFSYDVVRSIERLPAANLALSARSELRTLPLRGANRAAQRATPPHRDWPKRTRAPSTDRTLRKPATASRRVRATLHRSDRECRCLV